jgi:hypothetical protein
MSVSAYGFQDVYPTFGDLDGDGDHDMIIGELNGDIHYFENIASPGAPADFVLSAANYQGIDVGESAAPQLVDINRDSKLDLVIGERNGNLNYFENIGTTSNAIFAMSSNFFGEVDVREFGMVTGYSTPFFYENSGNYELLCGSQSGSIYHFNGIEGNLFGTFTLLDSSFQNIWEGVRTAIVGGDVTDNGSMELFIGNLGGGLAFYSQESVVGFENPSTSTIVNIQPNPAVDYLTISMLNNSNPDASNITLSVFAISGQKILEQQFAQASDQITLNLKGWNPGLYVLKIQSSQHLVTKRFVVLK